MSEGQTMERPEHKLSLTHVGAGMAAAAGLVQVLILYYIFLSRIAYPLDLEWMEGGMLLHAQRVVDGKPIYGPPSVEFISFLYTPFYGLLVGWLGKVVGLSYLLGRVVSVLSFTAVLAVVFLAVRRQCGRGWAGALWGTAACGLVASTFQHTGAWYDLVRNDSLYLALVATSLYLLRYHNQSARGVALAGVLAVLAFFTKQTASLFIVLSGVTLLLMSWRRHPIYVVIVGAGTGALLLLGNALTDGWFWKYTFEMHQGHDLYWDRIWPVTELTLLGFFPAVGLVFGVWLLAAPVCWLASRSLSRVDRGNLYWALVALVGIAVSAVGYATQWASKNAFIPGLLFPGMFVAMGVADLVRRLAGSGRSWPRVVVAASLSLMLGGLLAAQMVGQLYDPENHIPTDKDRVTGEKLIKRLRAARGEVLMPYHPFYPVLAGKKPHYHQMGINDVGRAGFGYPESIRSSIDEGRYELIILDNPPQGRYDYIYDTYRLGHYFPWKTVPTMITGYPVRPTYLFVRKQRDKVPAGARRVFGFEDKTFEGWTVTGEAFGQEPVGGPTGYNQGPVGPFEGKYLVNSYHGGDSATGRMLSPEFSVDRPKLTYRVGGGNLKGQLMVRLLVDGRQVYVGSGVNSDLMQQRLVDVTAHVGQKMQVELVDESVGAWGHLLFDDLVLHNR